METTRDALIRPGAQRPTPSTADPGAAPGRRKGWLLAGACGLLLLLLGLGLLPLLRGDDGGAGAGLVFTIPAGSDERVIAGLDSAIEIPTAIRFAPGEEAAITIRNLDEVDHRAGPWLVGAGQTYTQRFPSPGEYPIACAVDPAESVVVTVES